MEELLVGTGTAVIGSLYWLTVYSLSFMAVIARSRTRRDAAFKVLGLLLRRQDRHGTPTDGER